MGYVRLERCRGPTCPNCGCQDTRILVAPRDEKHARSWWGSGKARCNYCSVVFYFQSEPNNGKQIQTQETPIDHQEPVVESNSDRLPVVAYIQTRCPACHSARTRVSSTRRPIRWHKCRDCGHTFKSYEGQ